MYYKMYSVSGTIKDNIRLNNKDIPDEEIVRMAKYVNAHHFIKKLPQQYEEPVIGKRFYIIRWERQVLAFAEPAFNPAY